MKKLIASLGTAAAYFSIAGQTFAGASLDPCPEGQTDGSDFGSLCTLTSDSTGNIIVTVVTVLLIAATVIALFFLIWNGIRWVTSGGDKGKVTEARNGLIAAIIGLLISFLAYFILSLVLGFFNLDPGDLQLPSLTAQ